MSEFNVLLRVTSARLAMVLEALADAATLVSVLPCEPSPERGEAARWVRAPAASRFVNGKRAKGVSGQQLVLRALARTASGSLTTKQLVNIFIAQGFSGNSFSPAVSELKTKGLVEQAGLGKWKLTENGRVAAAAEGEKK